MYRILLIIIFNFLMINFSFGQIDQKLLDEVKKRKISYVEEAVYELNRNGISIEQASISSKLQSPHFSLSSKYSAWHLGHIIF